MNTTSYSVSDLDRLQDLAERYARYSRSAGGLSSLLGGAFCLSMFVLALITPLSPLGRVLLASLPLLWLIAKEALRRFYYQRDGEVLERLTEAQWRLHFGLTAFVGLVAVVIVGLAFYKFGVSGLWALPWQQQGYFAFVAAMPLVVWRWLWSSSDFIVGVSMFCQSAVILAGGHYGFDLIGAYMPFAAAIGILMGYREHRDYLMLRAELARVARQSA